MHKNLIDLKKNEKAEVVELEGGEPMSRRLESMGIRPGKMISRISSQLMGGPIIVMVDGRQTAMGRGMAAKVRVQPVDSN